MLSRRRFLQASAGAGALLLAQPSVALGGVAPRGARRRSPLVRDRFLVHSDLHNHSLLSDAFGDPASFYPAMREAGFDTACLTDHGIMGKYHGDVSCQDGSRCSYFVGINETRWQRLGELADEHHRDGDFVAFRAFEWSSATVGHLNVWFSQQWIDALVTGSLISPRASRELRNVADIPPEIVAIFNDLPDTASIDGFYEWLATEPGGGLHGGGGDGIAGFTHPNEFGDAEGFKLWPEVVDQVVSCEALNSDRDFFHWTNEDGRSPYGLNACLNAGWRVGLLGTSDEHSEQYARPGLGRGGLWVRELSRAGVREALVARATFATNQAGLRLAATAGGGRMGSTVPHREGPVDVVLDLDRGPEWRGKELTVQVVRPGEAEPVLADLVDVRVGEVSRFTVEVDVAEGDWMFLRLVDRERPAPEDLPSPWRDAGGAVAYASPWWFDPDAPAGSPARPDTDSSPAPSASSSSGLPATGGGLGGAAAAVLAAALLRRRSPHQH